jgi:hypothetical protein
MVLGALLDFTYSVYIAAYFTVRQLMPKVRFGLDGRWAMNRAMALLRKEKNANHVIGFEAFQGDEKSFICSSSLM